MTDKISMYLWGLVLICLISLPAQAQKKNKKKEKPANVYGYASSSGDPGAFETHSHVTKRNSEKGKRPLSFNKQLDKKVEEYHERMKENKKRYNKMAQLAKKPQYSDPSYFGHKRKPKKRKPGKKKFCKECEMVH